MSAAEVIARAHQSAGGTWWAGAHDHAAVANHILNALKAAGYAVVELPKPDALADDFTLVGNEIRQYDRNGFGAYRRFDLAEASTLARALLSLLAAADAVEAGAE